MRVLYISILTLLLVIGGYVYWWFHVADTMVALAENWKQQRISEGYEISHKPLVTSGFPYRVRITADALSLSNPTHFQKPRLDMESLWAVAQPWQVNHIIFGVEGRMNSNWLEDKVLRSLDVDAATALGSATFNTSGRLKTVAIDVTDIDARPSWRPPLKADRLQVHGRPADKITDGQQIAVRLNGVTVDGMDNFPLGKTIQEIAISSILQGTIEKLPSEASLTKWSQNGGYLDVKAMDIQWGHGSLNGDGRIALDNMARPTGTLKTRISGYGKILEALSTTGEIDPKTARMIGFGLDQLASEEANGTKFLTLPLSAQEGGMYLGPIYLMPVSPLY